MNTSKIKIRPFIPTMKDENIEKREPFAILNFGNVTIELDYTIMRYLKLGVSSDLWAETISICHRGFEEIVKEMELNMYGEMPRYHRDTVEFKNLPFTHNPLKDFKNEGYINYE